MKQTKNWYVARNASDSRGLVADEKTGENIAVSYRPENAPLLASAPEAIELLAETLDMLNNMTSVDFSIGKDKNIREKIAEFLDRVNA